MLKNKIARGIILGVALGVIAVVFAAVLIALLMRETERSGGNTGNGGSRYSRSYSLIDTPGMLFETPQSLLDRQGTEYSGNMLDYFATDVIRVWSTEDEFKELIEKDFWFCKEYGEISYTKNQYGEIDGAFAKCMGDSFRVCRTANFEPVITNGRVCIRVYAQEGMYADEAVIYDATGKYAMYNRGNDVTTAKIMGLETNEFHVAQVINKSGTLPVEFLSEAAGQPGTYVTDIDITYEDADKGYNLYTMKIGSNMKSELDYMKKWLAGGSYVLVDEVHDENDEFVLHEYTYSNSGVLVTLKFEACEMTDYKTELTELHIYLEKDAVDNSESDVENNPGSDVENNPENDLGN